MVKNIDVIEFEDLSVRNLMNKTAEDLRKKYQKQRKINERLLRKKTPIQKVLSIILDGVSVLCLFCAFVVCFSILNTTLHGYMPNFAGYTNLIVSSGSMVKSGFEIGDILVIHSVDAKTLNVDDKIAFYNYYPSYGDLDESQLTNVSNQVAKKKKYTFSVSQLLGFQSKEIEQAAKAESKIIFHHIRDIYVDENGERWFTTYGSSNLTDDSWYVNENYIVGVQDEGFVSKTVLGTLDLFSGPKGIIVISIPLAVLLISLILSFMKNVQIAKLELDCVEEKRKITDPICVKNNVGFQMSNKTKFKILAQTDKDNREEYINLLWKNGKVPSSVKKYYMRKDRLLSTNRALLELNRECEQMFNDGVKPTKIASYYLITKKEIEQKDEKIKQRIKAIDKIKQENKKSEKQKEKKKKLKKN